MRIRNAVVSSSIVLASLVSALAQEAAAPLKPAPDAAAVEKSAAEIRQLFAADYAAAKTPVDKAALAKKLHQLAGQTGDDAVGLYALLEEVQKLAGEGGDFTLAMQAIDELGEKYDVQVAARASVILVNESQKPMPAERRRAWYEAALGVVEQAISRDDYRGATNVAALYLAVAQKAKDSAAIKDANAAKERIAAVAAGYETAKDALALLSRQPDDPAANAAAGKFFCFDKGDWKRGLPLLAIGTDHPSKHAAVRELEPVSTPASIADAWWEIADSMTDPESSNIKAHAAEWYRKALPSLTGLTKAQAEKRLSSLAVAENASAGATGRVATLRNRFAPDAVKIGDHYYKVFLGPVPWPHAEAKCKQMGGYLTCLETKEEQQEVAKIKGENIVWVGGVRKGDKFRWVKGSAISEDRLNQDVKEARNCVCFNSGQSLHARKENGILDAKHRVVEGFVCEWDE